MLKNRNDWQNIGGIGVGEKNLLDKTGNPSTNISSLCAKFGYSLKFWTIVEDSPNPIPFGCKNYREVYITLAKLGVTGFITEFPTSCYEALAGYADGSLEKKEKLTLCDK